MAEPIKINPTEHLPLTFTRSEPIPPAPTRSGSTIDWIPDFAGYSWVAYGASTLLVISHLPSPLSSDQTLTGPIRRQVFELSGDPSSPVSSVSWSPATPSSGDLAAASENCICVFSHDSACSTGSFCWSQNAVLVHSSKVEAIKWTGSGDGIVAGGVEVVLWRRRNRSWEIAWKFKGDGPQNLVSASCSIEGPSATASSGSKPHFEGGKKSGNSVLVSYCDGMPDYTKAELLHPQPVSMIQWRPSSGKQTYVEAKSCSRDVLLTCCFDGTVRLWTQVENGKVSKLGKEDSGHKIKRRSFCVAVVIEVNQVLKGILGVDIYISWASEIGGIHRTQEGDNQFFSTKGNGLDKVGSCDWLIGFGPGTLITFWAVHCLDDISPMRFPRATLWKRQELEDPGDTHLSSQNSKDWLTLNKVVILRNFLSGPPDQCFFIYLLPSDSFLCTALYLQKVSDTESISPDNHNAHHYVFCTTDVIPSVGHSGKILQVAVHPHFCEVELAASLDANRLLLIWQFSSVANSPSSPATLVPTWKHCGKSVIGGDHSKYTSIKWAPCILDEDRMLLMGHVGGIDCYIVKISQVTQDVACHYVCTIPFLIHASVEDGPNDIFAVPLGSPCSDSVVNHRFLLLGVWMKSFLALSWEVTLHAHNLLGNSCECNDDKVTSIFCMWRFAETVANKRYCLSVHPCSSQLPEPHCDDQITSFSVAFPDNSISMQGILDFDTDPSGPVPPYIMATGSSDGRLKLWRNNFSKHATTHIPWELVGNFVAHQGPISAICLTHCGQKIATFCSGSSVDGTNILHIWDTVNLVRTGSFILAGRLSFSKDIVGLTWLALGNGQLLLGVYSQNTIQLFAEKYSVGQTILNTGKPVNAQGWFCLAVSNTFPPISNFLWGPQATIVIVHDNYFSLHSQWLSSVKGIHARNHQNLTGNGFEGGKCKGIASSIFTDCSVDIGDINELLVASSAHHVITTRKNSCLSSSLIVAKDQLEHRSSSMLGRWKLLEVADKLIRMLPVCHPESLLLNISSGNWKRAFVSVRHLAEYVSSSYASEKKSISAKHIQVIPQIPLSNYLEGLLVKDSTLTGFQWNYNERIPASSSHFLAHNFKSNSFDNLVSSSLTKTELGSFIESLEKYDLAALAIEKLQILAIIDLLSEIQNSASAYQNLDEPGRRFWVRVRFQQLHFIRSFGRSPSMDELVVDSGMMCWAFHSDCQEVLLSAFLPDDPSWKEMRTLGVGFWFTNDAQLCMRVEKLARSQYLRKRDPKDCALLYIALNRLQVLAGLFKVSRDEKDKPLVAFLSRNFQEEKNKAAALKNAYVLLGKHQLELAIAFFLLGGDAYSAVSVCAKNLGDEQLALLICRLIECTSGPLERHLITKLIVPAANDRGDCWLASLLEWELGNYYQSFLHMLGIQAGSLSDRSALTSNQAAFMDPNVGLYCILLTTKNTMKNAIGEENAAILGRWAAVMASTAFKRRGLPLDALDCISSSVSTHSFVDQGSKTNIDDSSQTIHQVLKPSTCDSVNWISGDVALQLESFATLDMALQYFAQLVREHPSWSAASLVPCASSLSAPDYDPHQFEKLLENYREKFYAGLAKFEQKYSVVSSSIIEKILVWLHNNGLVFIGCDVLLNYASEDASQHTSQFICKFSAKPFLHKQLLKAIEEISLEVCRLIVCCSISCFRRQSCYKESDGPLEIASSLSVASQDLYQGFLSRLWTLRSGVTVFSSFLSGNNIEKAILVLNLFEYYVHFAFAWLRRNSKGLIMMVQPLLNTFTNGFMPYEVDMNNLKTIMLEIMELFCCDLPPDGMNIDSSTEFTGETVYFSYNDEKWYVIGACLWQYMARFLKHKLHPLLAEIEHGCSSALCHGNTCSVASGKTDTASDCHNIQEETESFLLMPAKMLKDTIQHMSSYHLKVLGSFLQHKLEDQLDVPIFFWLKDYVHSEAQNHHSGVGLESTNIKDERLLFDMLWNNVADRILISEGFAHEKINLSQLLNTGSTKGWADVYETIVKGRETGETPNHEDWPSRSPFSDEVRSPAKGFLRNGRSFLGSWQKDATVIREVSCFTNAKEVYRRDGELIEALCLNCTNERQVALASNRKGITFFNSEHGSSVRDESNYIWSGADWPLNGWAGAESTPVPTCISPGVGLGSKKGTHLGLGGATIGMASSSRPGIDLTGGGAFGVPGYAGIAASGLGWEVQEGFEELVDPLATVENVSSRALSSHPSRPFLLVGSSNTHIYLWEFGKEKATATYGVLPAANVPPPYALASVSAVQFGPCGHRFATAALDGTICTWQLEVGGRSNIRPTESSLCFNDHASDVTYITSSGSVIAAAGSSSNGVNVVIWDTLAPPTTSRASIISHEGGARSISVFDNDIGSGSISPLIVTGGKDGTIGLHDFRYIATGKTKRHKHFDITERTGSGHNSDNQNGMLWYIPKAHSGSVTKIRTIRHTSLFLSGSADGDVKLWDAKAAKLVYHWPKLHERHTFLQPSTLGFGGVVRAGVTDIQVVPNGFLTCGGDGSVKLVHLNNHQHEVAASYS